MVLPTIHCEIYTMSDCGGFQTFWFLSLCANCYTDFPFLDYCFWLLLDFISSVIVYIHVPDNAIFITMSTFGLSCCGAGMLMYCVYCCFGASCTLWCEGLLIVHWRSINSLQLAFFILVGCCLFDILTTFILVILFVLRRVLNLLV